MSEVIARIQSVHLKNERPIWIRPPRDPFSTGHLTLCLDGEYYRDQVGACAVIDELQGDIADSWFVFVSMESVEARWSECPCHPPFARFVAEELLPWLGSQFRELNRVRQRTLIGLSFTGLAAAFIAQAVPGLFQRVVAQSGSFWWKDGWLAEQYQAGERVPTAFYLDVGNQERAENVRHREDVLQGMSQIEGVRRFRDVLRGKGYPVEYAEFEGGHEFAAWRRALPGALRWALRK